MRKITAVTAAAGIAAVIVGSGTSPALAATWTVGGNTHADGSYSASSGTFTLKDTSTGAQFTCPPPRRARC